MLIRKMTETDLDGVLAVEQASFSAPWSRAMFVGELRQEITRYCVAEADGKIVGYMGLYHVADEGHITNIAVLPAYRRRGIASALLRSFTDWAKQEALAFLTLEVRAGNENAIRLYEKFGFRSVGIRPHYYENKEDALLMTKYFEERKQ